MAAVHIPPLAVKTSGMNDVLSPLPVFYGGTDAISPVHVSSMCSTAGGSGSIEQLLV